MERNENKAADFDLTRLVSEAEEKFREGLASIDRWTNQVRTLVQTKPSAILAGLAAGGFMTGLALRRGRGALPATRFEFTADPLIVFFTAAVAGIVVGPRIVDEFLSEGIQPQIAGTHAGKAKPNPTATAVGTGVVDLKPSGT